MTDRPLRGRALCPGQCEWVISVMTTVSEWSQGHPASERHRVSGAPRGAAPFGPPASLLAFPTHPTPLLAVPSPGAGLCGPVSLMALCCCRRDEFGDLGASTRPLPAPAGSIHLPACPPHFLGPRLWSMGFMVSCACGACAMHWPSRAWPFLPVTPCNWALDSQELTELFLSSGNS